MPLCFEGHHIVSRNRFGGCIGSRQDTPTVGIEADRISQVVGQMLSTGLASSAEEGLDLITAALQKVPAAVREDILDATDEYGPFFAQIGMSGDDAMNALVEAEDRLEDLGEMIRDEAGITWEEARAAIAESQ